jgi:hypothetical protein
MVGGTAAEHNGYDTDGASVAVVRCPGSARRDRVSRHDTVVGPGLDRGEAPSLSRPTGDLDPETETGSVRTLPSAVTAGPASPD